MARSNSRKKYESSRSNRIDTFKKKFLGLKGAHHLTKNVSGYNFMKENSYSKVNLDYSRATQNSKILTPKIDAQKSSFQNSYHLSSAKRTVESLHLLKGKINRYNDFKR